MTTTELRIIIDDVQAIAKLKEMKVLSEGVKSSMNNWNSSFTGVLNNLTKVNNAFGKIIQANNMIGHMMVGGAMFGVFNMVHKAFEMIHEVGKEEGLIERTLENLGNTTKIHFEDIKKSSLEISKNLAMPLQEVMKSVNPLLEVSKISRDKGLYDRLQRMTFDVAAGMDISPENAAKQLANMVQNPMTARSILKAWGLREPKDLANIKAGVKAGQVDKVVTAILDVIESKSRGAALKEAQKDPLYGIKQAINDFEIAIGPKLIDLLGELTPILVDMIGKLKTFILGITKDDIVTWVGYVKLWFEAWVTYKVVDMALNLGKTLLIVSSGFSKLATLFSSIEFLSIIKSIKTLGNMEGALAFDNVIMSLNGLSTRLIVLATSAGAGVAALSALPLVIDYLMGKATDNPTRKTSITDIHSGEFTGMDKESRNYRRQMREAEEYEASKVIKNRPGGFNMLYPFVTNPLFNTGLYAPKMGGKEKKGTPPTMPTFSESSTKVQSSNKQFIININGGLINTLENIYTKPDSSTREDAKNAVIEGIINGLNALPGYTN